MEQNPLDKQSETSSAKLVTVTAGEVTFPAPIAKENEVNKPDAEVNVGPTTPIAAVTIASGYVDHLIGRLTDRAVWLGRLNAWILGLTAAIITACIVIFWRSDSIVENLSKLEEIRKENASEREKLITKRDKLAAQFDDADFKLAAIDTKENALSLVYSYLNIVQSFSRDWKSSGSYASSEVIKNCRARIASLLADPQHFRLAISVVESIAVLPPDVINIDNGNKKITIPPELLKSISSDLAANGGIRAEAVAKEIKEIDKLLRNVDVALVRADERDVQKQLTSLETLLAKNFDGVKKVYDKYAEEKKIQVNQSQALRLTNVRQELGRVDTQLAELDKQTAELQRKAYESVNSYGAWVPSLAVRVCCVIMALFLTQFFMSIYRYNTMIANHYHSRADILRMVCTQGQTDPVNADTFGKLAASMTIEKFDLILPDNPAPALLNALNKAR